MIKFEGFPKIPRFNRAWTITEKLDGTNGSVVIMPEGDTYSHDDNYNITRYEPQPLVVVDKLAIYAGSRTRYVTPGKQDNFGFAAWVLEHAEELAMLGVGRHFGEWYGSGIQRGYGLNEKRFALFNTRVWADGRKPRPPCCEVVTTLATHTNPSIIETTLQLLREKGSQHVPGFMRPEGIVVYQHAAHQLFKVTLEGDEKPKGSNGPD